MISKFLISQYKCFINASWGNCPTVIVSASLRQETGWLAWKMREPIGVFLFMWMRDSTFGSWPALPPTKHNLDRSERKHLQGECHLWPQVFQWGMDSWLSKWDVNILKQKLSQVYIFSLHQKIDYQDYFFNDYRILITSEAVLSFNNKIVLHGHSVVGKLSDIQLLFFWIKLFEV